MASARMKQPLQACGEVLTKASKCLMLLIADFYGRESGKGGKKSAWHREEKAGSI